MTLYIYSPSITLFNTALPVAAAGGGQTKITKLVDCFINDIDVVWLDIHVNHVSGVHMLQCQANLQSQRVMLSRRMYDYQQAEAFEQAHIAHIAC